MCPQISGCIRKRRKQLAALVGVVILLLLGIQATLQFHSSMPSLPRPRMRDWSLSGAERAKLNSMRHEPFEDAFIRLLAESGDGDGDDSADKHSSIHSPLQSTTSAPSHHLRSCAPYDLACRIQDIPFYQQHPQGRRAKRVLLVLVNSGFKEMALNLICSADMLGTNFDHHDDTQGIGESDSAWVRGAIPRSSWLIACSDEESYNFFLEHGVATVRLNETSIISTDAQTVPDVSAPTSTTSASSWGSRFHIDLNRAKVPLVLSLLELGVDVILVDADVIIRRPLIHLWNGPPSLSDNTDLHVMFDSPTQVQLPSFGAAYADCLSHPHTNQSLACRQVWEMNGGFYLLRAGRRTQQLFRDMCQWLKERPQSHDQDALRAGLRSLAQKGQLAWRMEDGSVYPPLSDEYVDGDDTNPILTYRFLPSLLATNGGLFFMDARSSYLQASSPIASPVGTSISTDLNEAGVEDNAVDPVIIHVNWVVGYARKVALMQQYGLWFVSGPIGRGDATSSSHPGRIVFRQAQCKATLLREATNRLNLKQSRNKHQTTELVHPPPNPIHISSRSDYSSLVRPSTSTIYHSSTSIIFFSTPKPFSSYTTTNQRRSRPPDADGMGGVELNDEDDAWSDEQGSAYASEQALQLRTHLQTLRNWYALTHTDATMASNHQPVIRVALFTSDLPHAHLASSLNFDTLPLMDVDEYQVPRLKTLFRSAELLAAQRGSSAVMYSNADIWFDRLQIQRTVEAIQEYEFDSWMATGMRNNVEAKLVEQLESEMDREDRKKMMGILESATALGVDASNASSQALSQRLRATTSLFSRLATLSVPYRSDALDFMLWSVPCSRCPGGIGGSSRMFSWDMVPNFLIGRIAWDNWMLHHANAKAKTAAASGAGIIAVVDVTETVQALHINHGSSIMKSQRVHSSTEAVRGSNSALVSSHFQPNSMQNVRLGGLAGVYGVPGSLGRLEHAAFKSVALANGAIRIVRRRPVEGGHTADLYDVAREAHILVHERPTLIVTTVDDAHVTHFQHWLRSMRKALRVDGKPDKPTNNGDGTSFKTGILMLSAGGVSTTTCQQSGISAFELSPGGSSANLNHGAAHANTQIAALRARAVLLLLEFGYDVLLVPITAAFFRNPFRVMAERTDIYSDTVQLKERRAERIAREQPKPALPDDPQGSGKTGSIHPDPPSPSSESFNPTSPVDGLHMGEGMDLIAFAYDSAPFNVSSSLIFYRHTPATLKMWRRMLPQILSLQQRAQHFPQQASVHNLGLDWYIQFELYSNHVSISAGRQLVWGIIVLDDGYFDLDGSPAHVERLMNRPPSVVTNPHQLPKLPAGPIRDRDMVMANGYWYDRSGGLGLQWADGNMKRMQEVGMWSDDDQRPAGRTLLVGEKSSDDDSNDYCRDGRVKCGKLPASELSLVLSKCTVDRSILLVPVPDHGASQLDASSLDSTPLNLFLERLVEIGFSHVVLVASSTEALMVQLTEENRAAVQSWAVLYGSGMAESEPTAHSTTITKRVYQLLQHHIHVGIANIESALLFDNPFTFYTNLAFENEHRQDTHAASRRTLSPSFLSAQGMWLSSLPHVSPAFLRPLTDLACDIHSQLESSVSLESSMHHSSLAMGFVSNMDDDESGSDLGWAFLSIQPTQPSATWMSHVVACTSDKDDASVHVSGLPLQCMRATSMALQQQGGLSTCPLDDLYFPSPSAFLLSPPSSSSLTSMTPPSPLPSDSAPLWPRGSGLTPSSSNAVSPRHPAETGVWPLLVPIRAREPRSGRMFEWDKEWRSKYQAILTTNHIGSVAGQSLPPIAPPTDTESSGDASRRIFCPSSDPGSSSTSSAYFYLRIRVLTFNRAASLRRLLNSLGSADFLNDSGKIHLEISVDRVKREETDLKQQDELDAAADVRFDDDIEDETPRTDSHRRQQVLSMLRNFQWSHGPLTLTLHRRHLGLVGQWLSGGTLPTSMRDLTLVLEDDLELSPHFYVWLKGAICKYYIDADNKADGQADEATNFDPNLYGISLQNQQHVLGTSAKNHKLKLVRFREEKSKRQQQQHEPSSDADPSTSSNRYAARIDPSTLIDVATAVGDPSDVPAFKYQLPGTWGLLIFPPHWLRLHAWYTAHQQRQQPSERDGAPSSPPFRPCAPHIESSSWWSSRPTSVWSQWLIRFAFEQGWYCLYSNLPQPYALAVNHREAGANHRKLQGLGAREQLLLTPPTYSTQMQHHLSISSAHRFAFPPTSSLSLFDFHLRRVNVSPIVLQQRLAMLTPGHLRRGCDEKDYRQYL